MNFKMPAVGNFIPVGVALVALVACLGTYVVQSRTMTQLETNLEEAREESQRLLYLGGTGFTIYGKSSPGSQEYR